MKLYYAAPSIDRLISQLQIDSATAEQVRKIIQGKLDPASIPKTSAWIRQCYNMPSDIELRMSAIDTLIGGHGREAIEPYSDGWPRAEYSNQGDSYAATILYDYQEDCFILTSWGDFVEQEKL